MWSPTHVQVTVQRAKDLLIKGKNGTNDVFVTIALGKVKYQTSVKEKASGVVEWHEQCELIIPENANTASVVLTALHRNFLGVDEFLGVVKVPLADFDVYERPRNRWYSLSSKPGKENSKARGDLEVKIAFQVRAEKSLSKGDKHKLSLGHLSEMKQTIGGSLLSIGSSDKRRSIKSIAKSFGDKVKGKKNESFKQEDFNPPLQRGQVPGEADPGVISEGEDEFTFDDLSHKSSSSSLTTASATLPAASSLENLGGGELLRRVTPPAKPPRTTADSKPCVDEWQEKLFGRSVEETELNVSNNKNEKNAKNVEEEKDKTNSLARKLKLLKKDSKLSEIFPESKPSVTTAVGPIAPYERIIIGGESEMPNSTGKISHEVMLKFKGKSREELVELVCELQGVVEHQQKRMKDMEDYLDDLLLRVMETSPRLLQNPYVTHISSSG